MDITTTQSLNQPSDNQLTTPEVLTENNTQALNELLLQEVLSQLGKIPSRTAAVLNRIIVEVERICEKSDRIQASGKINEWQLSLARHRLEKCLSYYKLGSKQGRTELHSNLSVMIYRHVAQPQSQLGFSARYNLIEDFLQDFYTESLRIFRRENQLEADYTPRTQMEIAEYMGFTEQYAKRRINLRSGNNQQLIILRAQTFAKRQPSETAVDIEQTMEFPKDEGAIEQNRSALTQQVRAHLIAETTDPYDFVLRDRVVQELIEYLEDQGRQDCIDYLVLKLQDYAVADIDEMLGLTPRQRDYLQQRFKYHVEKFAYSSSHWKLVHQWLGADLDQKLGMSSQKWEVFVEQLDYSQQQLLSLKQSHLSEQQIAKKLGCTPKQLKKRWTKVLQMAWMTRNSVENNNVSKHQVASKSNKVARRKTPVAA
ncbi:MAG: HetZ-related protein [Symploca sp. SIO1B1]|nr:HetZ-related protein [Symploca sp. SIO1C2]NER51300.1 HetZ-related protein [Symploca sp. SIO1A3]NES00228.1 HetZ-related protein [Symploca sp. SIO1B1]